MTDAGNRPARNLPEPRGFARRFKGNDMPKTTLNIILRLLAFGAILGTAACRIPDMNLGLREKHEPDVAFVLTLHEFVPPDAPDGRLVRAMPTVHDNRNVWIRRIPLLSSRVIHNITVTAADEGEAPALTAALDMHGRFLWMQLCGEYGGRLVAVAVDGVYRFAWRVPPPHAHARDAIVIQGPWNLREAELVAQWAPKNYAKWHKEVRK